MPNRSIGQYKKKICMDTYLCVVNIRIFSNSKLGTSKESEENDFRTSVKKIVIIVEKFIFLILLKIN